MTSSAWASIVGGTVSPSSLGSLHESALSVRHLGRSMNGLRAGMAAPPLMAAARVAAGVTSLTCQEPTFTGPLPNRRSRPEAAIRLPLLNQLVGGGEEQLR